MTDREWTARVKRAEENARLLSKLPAMKCGYALRVGGERCKPPVVEYVTSAKDKDKHLLRVEYTDLNSGLKEFIKLKNNGTIESKITKQGCSSAKESACE